MSRAMNSEASSSMRWSEKPSAPSWGRAWLARSRALSTSEASGSGISSGVAGSCLSTSVARAGGSGSRGRSSSGNWVAKVSSPPGVNLPARARIGQRSRWGRAVGQQAGGAPGGQRRDPAGLGLGLAQDLEDLLADQLLPLQQGVPERLDQRPVQVELLLDGLLGLLEQPVGAGPAVGVGEDLGDHVALVQASSMAMNETSESVDRKSTRL